MYSRYLSWIYPIFPEAVFTLYQIWCLLFSALPMISTGSSLVLSVSRILLWIEASAYRYTQSWLVIALPVISQYFSNVSGF